VTVKVAINGFGRIGRCVLTHIVESCRKDIQVVAINAPGPLESAVHLLKYDSVHGRFANKISIQEDTIDVGTGPIRMFSSYNPEELDWSGLDVVLECTGELNSRKKTLVHLENGARKVLISAPGKKVDKTIVFGVNDAELEPDHLIVSNGSCTTNCLAPIAKILDEGVGIISGIMTTIHSYTNDQAILDKRHKDLYRARAAALSIIPTSTGAAEALGEVLPSLIGKLVGSALRVPTPNVSAVDLTFQAKKTVTVDSINSLVQSACLGSMGKVLSYDTEPKVSIDFNHSSYSAIFAPDQTKVVGGNLVRVLVWYDNEWAFSCRMADVAVLMGRL